MVFLCFCGVSLTDPDAGGAGGLCWGDPGGEAGEDAAAHRVFSPFFVVQPGWGGPPSWSFPGTLEQFKLHFC